jgi:hypothetical protein
MLYLKSAVFDFLQSAPSQGYSNAEIGRALEIYTGHMRHEGHISRTILAMLEAEGLVKQLEKRGNWIAIRRNDN